MIVHDDILHWAETYDGPLFHAALMDCPYEMEFMGRDWDNSGVSFNPKTWEGIARHLHPGAFLLVMAGTINDDLISVAMRQAGLRKYHKAVYWSYGSGFPKSTRIDTAIDRRAGAERKVVGRRKHQPKFDAAGFEYRKKDNGYNSKDRESFDVTAPATELAVAWAGHRYGGQMLKPSAETILIFQKPYQGRPVDCITRTGAGALWIDGGRVGADAITTNGGGRADTENWRLTERVDQEHTGRWPANLLLQHTPECCPAGTRRVKSASGTNGTAKRETAGYQGGFGDRSAFVYADADGYETVTTWQCAEGCPVAALDAQSGVSESKRSERGEMNTGCLAGIADTGPTPKQGTNTTRGHNDSGGASRFFHQSSWAYEIEERIAAADPVRYCAKASKSEREAGLDPMQIKLLGMMEAFEETTVDDGRKTPIDNAYQRGETRRRNTHPCLKPLDLTRYLATLLLPPDAYAPRRILIPFSGVASEYLGAVLAGWEEVVGVELSEEYIKIAQARVAFWRALRYRLLDPAADLSVDLDEGPDQPSLFDLLDEVA